MTAVLAALALLLLLAGVALLRLRRQGHYLTLDLNREREENRRLRELLQAGTQMAQDDLSQLRKLRHDLRHYLLLAGDPSAAAEADALRQSLDATPAAAGGSWAFSALERYYRDKAQALGFQADLHLTPPQGWDEAMPDLFLILSNLLENAIEALEREGGGWLRARSVCAPGYFSLVVGNPCTRPLQTAGEHYLSSKAPGRFGVGLATVRDTAQRYGGQASFTVEDGVFRAAVFLLSPAPQADTAPRKREIPQTAPAAPGYPPEGS